MSENKKYWVLDKHVPLTVIFAVVMQTAAGIWWVSNLQHSVQDHERRMLSLEASKIAERMAVVEVQLRDSRDLQLEMNRKLDRLMDARDLRGI